MKAPKLKPDLIAHQAIEKLFFDAMFGRPDPDYNLKTAGVTREELEKMEGDDEIAAACETRREAVIATPWHLEPGDGDGVEFIWAQMEKHVESIIRCAWKAVTHGYSVGEAVYERVEGRIALKCFVEKPFGWFRPEITGELFMTTPEYGTSVQVDTTFKFFQTVRQQTYKQPYGEALFSRLYSAWIYRNYGWRYWIQFLERRGTPFIFGKSEGDLETFSEALEALIRGGTMAMDKGDEIGLLDSTNTGEAFGLFDDRISRRIQKLILGQTGTTDIGNAGSYAAAKVQDGVREDRRNSDIRMCSATVQRVVNALWVLNRFAGEVPEFCMEDDTGIQAERASRDGQLIKDGVIKRYSEDYILRTYDFEPGEFEIPEDSSQDLNQDQARQGSQDDAGDTQEDDLMGNTQVKAKAFSAGRFTPQQEAIEQIADGALNAMPQPIDPEAIKSAIRGAKDPQDLEERLAAVLSGVSYNEFTRQLERALYAADIMGYAHAGGK